MVPLFRNGTGKEQQIVLSGISTGNTMLRSGDWKLVRQGPKPWELYNLADDPTELKDLVEQQPEHVQRLSAQLKN